MAGKYKELIDAVFQGHTVQVPAGKVSPDSLRTTLVRELRDLQMDEVALGITDHANKRVVVKVQKGNIIAKLAPVQASVPFTIISDKEAQDEEN